MKLTPNLNLKKPDYTDAVDIKDINDNMDAIDTELNKKAAKTQVLTNVPANAVFTDTVTTVNSKTGVITKEDIVALGIPSRDTNTTYSEITTAEIDAGTSSTLRAMTGRRVKYIIDKVQGWIDGLTKSDIGLGNVDNVEQATKTEFDEHKEDGASHSKTARFVIGTSTAGWTVKDCHYLCDGTADQREINNAITALPETGGEVVILDGTYNITAKVDVTKDNVSIRGNGNATILKRMFNSLSTLTPGVIALTGRSGCKIANLQVDGNGASFANLGNSGISLDSSSNNTIIGNTCNNNNSYGIRITASGNNTVTGNTCSSNEIGILLYDSSNNTVTGNTCTRGTGLPTDYTAGQNTIWLGGLDNNYNLISNNNCMGKAPRVDGGTGNSVYGNKYDSGDYKDFTQDEKTKLAGISDEANKYTHPTSHPASIITQTASNRFVTDSEKATWNNKWNYNEPTIKAIKVDSAGNADTVNGKTVGTNVPTDAKFTDTITTVNGKTGAISKDDIVALGILAQDTELRLGNFKLVFNEVEDSLDIEVIA